MKQIEDYSNGKKLLQNLASVILGRRFYKVSGFKNDVEAKNDHRRQFELTLHTTNRGSIAFTGRTDFVSNRKTQPFCSLWNDGKAALQTSGKNSTIDFYFEFNI